MAIDGTIKKINLFEPNQKKILIFWATWCGPCTVELTRLNKMFEKNEINSSHVIAISSFEDPDLVLKTMKERHYTFPVGLDQSGSIAQQFEIRGTPTTVFIENGKIKSISTGISILIEKNFKDFVL